VLAPNVPASLQEVVARCLQKKPEQRFQTASDLAFSLRQLAASGPTESQASESVPAAAVPPTYLPHRVIWITPVVLAAIVLGVVLLWKGIPLGGTQPKQPRPATKAIEARVQTRLTWFDRSGKALSTVAAPAEYSGPAFSPDGDRIAVAMHDARAGARDLWILSQASGSGSRLTTEASDDLNPLWTPDSKWVIFTSAKDGVRNIYRKLADGTGPVEPVLSSTEDLNVEDISQDGQFLIFNFRTKGDPEPGLALLALATGKRTQIAAAPTRAGRFSPDKRWIAYESSRTGRMEIFVRGLSTNGKPASDDFRVSASPNFVTTPMWRGDGKELFFLEGHTLMAVEINTESGKVIAGSPRPLFNVNIEDEERRNRYLVSQDGKRFLFIVKDDRQAKEDRGG
jgi:WD40 repeat protein